jgi:phosphatidylethanolamine/phosphatidyl-N-methylethanolamine N-methyltransferase
VSPKTAAASSSSGKSRARKPKGQRVQFLKEFLANPTKIGAVAPSGKLLSRKMVEVANLADKQTIIEYGPGTGVVTAQIIRYMKPSSKFFAIELNPAMCEIWRAKFPDRTLYEGNVMQVTRFCRKEGWNQVDCIISGLPWSSWPERLQRGILDQMMKVLKPGGTFITFGYHVSRILPAGMRFARLLPEYFSTVERSKPIWRNIPSAFTVRCVR